MDELQQQYPFLILEKNNITYPGDSVPFAHVFHKLDSLVFYGKGQVNILHIGGSHVQAGVLSNRMRNNMLSLSPDIKNERGFFFPYKLAQTNNPSNYRVLSTAEWEGQRCSVSYHESKWGMSGVTATTRTPFSDVTIYAKDDDTTVYGFKKVRIYHVVSKNSFKIKMNSGRTIIHHFTDSTAGFSEFHFAEMQDTLKFSIVKTDSLQNFFTIQGVQYMTDKPSLVYHSIGVNGASTKSYLRCTDFEAQQKAVKPDLVIFGIGINDAYMPSSKFDPSEFEHRYTELIKMFRAANPNCSFLFLTNNDSYYKRRMPNPNVYKVSKSMLKLCIENGAALWDLFEIMGGYNSIKTWENYELAKADKIHFTKTGYELQADIMFDAFMRAYGNYIKNRY
ncbi:MAG: GDSL-type esterase/lipase family protein [Schleiferiaceae bacterium]|nr:GDSL-type esterase/lipase family protein [Schleiferiaceae bacterium]